MATEMRPVDLMGSAIPVPASLAAQADSSHDCEVDTGEARQVIRDEDSILRREIHPILKELSEKATWWDQWFYHHPLKNTLTDSRSPELVLEYNEWRVDARGKLLFNVKGLGELEDRPDILMHAVPDYSTFGGLTVFAAHLDYCICQPMLQSHIQSSPPRHARISEEVNGRVMMADLDSLIASGRELERRFDDSELAASLVVDWIANTSRTLYECMREFDPGGQIRRVQYDLRAITNPHIRNADLLTRACLVVAINYFSEVRNRMPDYLEGAGKSPQTSYSINISGGTIHGPVAMKLDAINSTIAGIIQEGSAEVGKALEDLKEAILVDTVDDEEMRQDLLDNLEALTEEANSAPNERKRGVVRSILASFKNAALSGPEVARVMEAWSQILTGLA